MRPAALVTVGAVGQFGDALGLAADFLALHAGARVRIVLADAADRPEPGAVPDHVEVLTAAEVAGELADVLAAGSEPESYAAALLPFALDGLERPVLALPVGAGFGAPLDLPSDGDALVLAAASDGAIRDDAVVLLGPGADPVLEWWRGRAADFAVQGSLAAALTRFPGVAVLHDPPGGAPAATADAVVAPAARDLDRLADGSPLDARLRRLFRRAIRERALTRGPFDGDGTVAFLRWLGEADGHAEHGGLPRLLVELWAHHDDLQRAYPDLRDPACRDGLVGWVTHHGAQTLGLPAAALPDLGAPAPERPPLGVNVAGYFQSEVGVGEAARRVVTGLDAARVPVLPVQGELVPTARRGHGYGAAPLQAAPFDVNLVCVNADGLPQFAAEAGPRFFDGRYTIGLWWWELPTFPERFRSAVQWVDEIWVGSRYVQDAISPAVDVPVVRMPMPVEVPDVRVRSRSELGLPEGFLVLFVFDFHSVMERKNPLGLLDAFRRAFPQAGSGAQLVIKAVNGGHHPAARDRLVAAVAEHPDVHLDERFVAADVRDGMLASCDVYASLHRSEGFGLTIAEAMALGRPVVATGYSGPADFLDDETAWVVPHRLVPVGDGHPPYDADGRWADPDLDVAAAALRAIRDDPQEAERRGARAREAMRADHAADAAGAAMRARLEALRPAVDRAAASRPDRRPPELGAALQTARTQVGLIGGGSPPRRAAGLRLQLRRLVTGAGGAAGTDVVAAERAILRSLEQTVDRVAGDLERSRIVHGTLTASLLAEQRRLDAQLKRLASATVADGP